MSAYLEISSTKVWSLMKEEIKLSADYQAVNKLMKFALKSANEWEDDAIDVSTLKRMKIMAEKRLKDLGEI